MTLAKMAQTEFYREETADKPKLKGILQSEQNFSGAIFFFTFLFFIFGGGRVLKGQE